MVLAASDTVGAAWSPDGNWLAVSDKVTNGRPDQQHLRLFDKAGKPIRTLDGDYLVWLDTSRFVLSRSGTSFLGSAESTQLTPITADIPEGALSSAHGTVALVTKASGTSEGTFVIWTSTGTSQTLAGDPAAWSADGSKLAVWHYAAAAGPGIGSQPSGWLEVLSWPDLHVLFSDKTGSYGLNPISFDPSGRYLLATQINGRSILDLATGKMLGPSTSGLQREPAWDKASDLIVPDGSGSVTTWPASGGPAVTKSGLGNSAISSTDGSTTLYFYNQDSRPITLTRGGASRTIEVPGLVTGDWEYPGLSPDGPGVVIYCQIGMTEEALLLVN
jgi:hypothetical protein